MSATLVHSLAPFLDWVTCFLSTIHNFCHDERQSGSTYLISDYEGALLVLLLNFFSWWKALHDVSVIRSELTFTLGTLMDGLNLKQV